jgi:tripartite-type tricarboxylate transporter receptor subunit TctC
MKDLKLKRFSLLLGNLRRNAGASIATAVRNGLCVLGALSAAVAMAQEPNWPQRPVKIVVPYAAGGSSDSLGRLISVGLTESLKQPFVIENKGGAGGMIGSQ